MFINMNLGGDVAEPKPVAPGRYDLTIADATYRQDKNDVKVSIGIDGHLDAPNITHFISFPKPDDDEGKRHFKQLMLKRFLTQFGIPYTETGFEVSDLPGATGKAQVQLSEPDPTSGAVYNRIALDRLTD